MAVSTLLYVALALWVAPQKRTNLTFVIIALLGKIPTTRFNYLNSFACVTNFDQFLALHAWPNHFGSLPYVPHHLHSASHLTL
jgi:hypothetical protein